MFSHDFPGPAPSGNRRAPRSERVAPAPPSPAEPAGRLSGDVRSATVESIEPPGGFLVWMIVFLELVTFGAALAVFAVQRRAAPEEFAAGAALLNQPLALANTLILLTGGWCMVMALEALRASRVLPALRWLRAAIGSGIVFLGVKSLEFADKIEQGMGFGEDAFFSFYYAITGFHFLHVLAAAAILCYLAGGIRRGRYSGAEHFDVESGAVFWHMCDILWLLIYPVIYLL